MENVIIVLVVLIVVGGVIYYILRQKKKGKQCIGCPYCDSCTKKQCQKENSSK